MKLRKQRRFRIALDILTQEGEPTTYPFSVRLAGAVRFIIPSYSRAGKALGRYQHWRNRL